MKLEQKSVYLTEGEYKEESEFDEDFLIQAIQGKTNNLS